MKYPKLMVLVLFAALLMATFSPVAMAKPIELTFASSIPSVAPLARLHKRWGDMIEQKSGGRVKFVYYFGGSLFKQIGGEMLRGVQSGVVDFGYNPITRKYGFELNSITEVPFMGWKTMSQAAAVYNELLGEFPELRKEFKGVEPYAARPMPPNQLNTTKKLVRVPADIKGMKLYASGYISNLVEILGGAPVQVDVGDWDVSLNSGLIEGLGTHYVVVNVFKCMELVPHHTDFGEGGISFLYDCLFTSPNTWKRLPPDIVKIIKDLEPWLVEESIKVDTSEIQRAKDVAKGLGQTFTYLTPEEIQMWMTAAKPFHEKWIADNEANGLPARAVYEETKRLIAKYK